jgi:hypothetical protein
MQNSGRLKFPLFLKVFVCFQKRGIPANLVRRLPKKSLLFISGRVEAVSGRKDMEILDMRPEIHFASLISNRHLGLSNACASWNSPFLVLPEFD